MSLQDTVNKVESKVKAELPVVEAEAKKSVTVKVWVLVAVAIVALVVGHLL